MQQTRQAWFRSTDGGWWTKVDRPLARWLKCLQSDLLGHNWCDFVAAEDRELTRRATDAIQAGTIPPPYTQRWIATDGHDVHLKIHLLTQQDHAEKEIVGRVENIGSTRSRSPRREARAAS